MTVPCRSFHYLQETVRLRELIYATQSSFSVQAISDSLCESKLSAKAVPFGGLKVVSITSRILNCNPFDIFIDMNLEEAHGRLHSIGFLSRWRWA